MTAREEIGQAWHRLLDPMGSAPRSAPATASETAQLFNRSLSAMFAKRTPLHAGKIKVITLDHVRRALADTWQTIEHVARERAEQVLRGLLRPQDVCAITRKGDFVIVFADCEDDEAVLRAVHLSRRIEEELTREFGVARLAAETRVAALTPAQAKGGIDALDTLLDGAEELRGSGLWASADQAQLGDLAVSFRPLLREQQRVFIGYQARVNRLAADGTIRRGSEALGGIETGPMRQRLDTAICRSVVKVHTRAVQRGVRTLLSLPIAFESLDGPHGDKLVSFLVGLPADQRALLMVELLSAPEARPPDQAMWRAMKVLGSHLRLVAVQTNGSTAQVDGFLPHGVGAFSIDLEDPSGYRLQTLTTPRLASELTGFASRLRSRRLVTLLHGLDSRPLLEAGSAARFNYLSGSALARDTRKLQPPSVAA